ncbi:amidohydrolase family protein [Cupriavidus sp. 2TAF22]|uniref:amidohydrolase family protein n=1 Tax=unclassified Cupriavidus TaxID=2640874 RepID=UPI003F934E70
MTLQEKRTLLRGGTILTGDEKLGELRRGDLLIEGTRIAAIAPNIPVDGAEIVDADGMIVIPGFVDSHRHTWQSLLRAVGTDWTLGQYYTGMRLTMGKLYTPQDMQLANYLGALECLNAGITTLLDWSHNNNTPDHADAAIAGLRDAGIRAVWAYGNGNDEWIPPNDKPSNLNDVRRVRIEHFSSERQLLRMAFAARGPEFTPIDLTESEFRFARELDIPVTVHVGVGRWSACKPIHQLNSRGLLYENTNYVHCCTLPDDELRMLVDSGGSTSLAPDTALNEGFGDPPTLRLLAMGHEPSLSVDVVSSAPGDMFAAMRLLLSTTRGNEARRFLAENRDFDPIPLTSRQVFGFATRQGALACGFGDRVGTLVPGKEADVVLLNARDINMMPLNYSYGNIVESAHPGNVDSVFVAGRAVKRHGKLVGVDLDGLYRRVVAARDGLFEKAGLACDRHWMPAPLPKPDL